MACTWKRPGRNDKTVPELVGTKSYQTPAAKRAVLLSKPHVEKAA